MKRLFLFILLFCLFSVNTSIFADTVYVFDRSGSMSGQLASIRKIDIARAALSSTFGWISPREGVGFLSFPSDGNCGVKNSIPIDRARNARSRLKNLVGTIEPQGLTPLALAIDRAGSLIHEKNNNNRIIVITDGLETCNGDPVAAATKWRNMGLNITIHVISFAVDNETQRKLRLIAQAGGGEYLDVSSAADLNWLRTAPTGPTGRNALPVSPLPSVTARANPRPP